MVSKYLKTEGIILKVQPYLEADSLLKILSPEKGLLSAISKGARKVTSKRAGVIQPFNRALFELYRGTTFYTVSQARNIHPFAYLASDYEKGILLSFVTELLAETHQEGQLIEGAYNLLLSFFRIVEDKKSTYGFIYLGGFLLSYLKLLGFRLPLESCKFCKKAFEKTESGAIKAHEAAFICIRCSSEPNAHFEELKAFIKTSSLLEKLSELKITYPFAIGLRIERSLTKKGLLDNLSQIYQYMVIQTGIELKSYPMLKQAIESLQ
jgi:DNA repair protein RecO (recombination protein O)